MAIRPNSKERKWNRVTYTFKGKQCNGVARISNEYPNTYEVYSVPSWFAEMEWPTSFKNAPYLFFLAGQEAELVIGEQVDVKFNETALIVNNEVVR